jgi:glycosyltransferase involved in cell wall biosynthesis
MKISLITVCYNAASTIEDTLKSVAAQTHSDIEYIVVDGASTDGTLEIIKQYSHRVNHFISEPDKGLYDAMNKGFKAATGEVAGILNADDVFAHPEVLAHVAQTFEKNPTEGLYGDLEYVDNKGKVTRKWKSGHYSKNAFVRGWMPPHPTFYCRRSLYDKLGYFNLGLRTAADYELMLRFIHKQGISLQYMPEVMVQMRVGGVSNSSLMHRIKANREDRRAWALNGLEPSWYTLLLKPIRKVGQFF